MYQWARQVGGQRWGFLTAWVYVLALAATVAGAATGNAPVLAGLIGVDATPTFNTLAAFALALLAVAPNLAGRRLLAKATELGDWAGLLGLAFCGVYMLAFSRVQPLRILARPRTPEAGWFANWFVVIAMAVIVLVGIVQAALLVRGSPLARPVATTD